jgi:transposase
MNIITVGIDLAKNVFAVHGVDDNGKAGAGQAKSGSRANLRPLIAQLPPCVIGMEACSGAHHWARQFRQHGHTVKLMAPKFVTPYRMSGKRGKNDAADAAAICEAVTRPPCASSRSRKNTSRSSSACTAPGRDFVEERTATYNRLRGLIRVRYCPAAEGHLSASRDHRRTSKICRAMPISVSATCSPMPTARCPDRRVRPHHRQAASRRCAQQTADGTSRHRPDHRQRPPGQHRRCGHDFKNGRQVAAWIGLTPGNTAAAARPAWGGSPRPAIPICAVCW